MVDDSHFSYICIFNFFVILLYQETVGTQYACSSIEGELAMENIMPKKIERLDQKSENGDFCKLWKCSGLNVDYKCFACPILADLKVMRRELHMDTIEVARKAA